MGDRPSIRVTLIQYGDLIYFTSDSEAGKIVSIDENRESISTGMILESLDLVPEPSLAVFKVEPFDRSSGVDGDKVSAGSVICLLSLPLGRYLDDGKLTARRIGFSLISGSTEGLLGQPVRHGDSGQVFIHLSGPVAMKQPWVSDVLSTDQYQIHVYESYVSDSENLVHYGHIVQLKHIDNTYLTVFPSSEVGEKLEIEDVGEELPEYKGELPAELANTKENCNSYWVVERENRFLGGVVSLGNAFRLRHLVSGKYLSSRLRLGGKAEAGGFLMQGETEEEQVEHSVDYVFCTIDQVRVSRNYQDKESVQSLWNSLFLPCAEILSPGLIQFPLNSPERSSSASRSMFRFQQVSLYYFPVAVLPRIITSLTKIYSEKREAGVYGTQNQVRFETMYADKTMQLLIDSQAITNTIRLMYLKNAYMREILNLPGQRLNMGYGRMESNIAEYRNPPATPLESSKLLEDVVQRKISILQALSVQFSFGKYTPVVFDSCNKLPDFKLDDMQNNGRLLQALQLLRQMEDPLPPEISTQILRLPDSEFALQLVNRDDTWGYLLNGTFYSEESMGFEELRGRDTLLGLAVELTRNDALREEVVTGMGLTLNNIVAYLCQWIQRHPNDSVELFPNRLLYVLSALHIVPEKDVKVRTPAEKNDLLFCSIGNPDMRKLLKFELDLWVVRSLKTYSVAYNMWWHCDFICKLISTGKVSGIFTAALTAVINAYMRFGDYRQIYPAVLSQTILRMDLNPNSTAYSVLILKAYRTYRTEAVVSTILSDPSFDRAAIEDIRTEFKKTDVLQIVQDYIKFHQSGTGHIGDSLEVPLLADSAGFDSNLASFCVQFAQDPGYNLNSGPLQLAHYPHLHNFNDLAFDIEDEAVKAIAKRLAAETQFKSVFSDDIAELQNCTYSRDSSQVAYVVPVLKRLTDKVLNAENLQKAQQQLVEDGFLKVLKNLWEICNSGEQTDLTEGRDFVYLKTLLFTVSRLCSKNNGEVRRTVVKMIPKDYLCFDFPQFLELLLELGALPEDSDTAMELLKRLLLTAQTNPQKRVRVFHSLEFLSEKLPTFANFLFRLQTQKDVQFVNALGVAYAITTLNTNELSRVENSFTPILIESSRLLPLLFAVTAEFIKGLSEFNSDYKILKIMQKSFLESGCKVLLSHLETITNEQLTVALRNAQVWDHTRDFLEAECANNVQEAENEVESLLSLLWSSTRSKKKAGLLYIPKSQLQQNVSEATISELRTKMSSVLVVPSDPSYAEFRTSFQAFLHSEETAFPTPQTQPESSKPATFVSNFSTVGRAEIRFLYSQEKEITNASFDDIKRLLFGTRTFSLDYIQAHEDLLIKARDFEDFPKKDFFLPKLKLLLNEMLQASVITTQPQIQVRALGLLRTLMMSYPDILRPLLLSSLRHKKRYQEVFTVFIDSSNKLMRRIQINDRAVVEEQLEVAKAFLMLMQSCCDGCYEEFQDFFRDQDVGASLNIIWNLTSQATALLKGKLGTLEAEYAEVVLKTMQEAITGPNVTNQDIVRSTELPEVLVTVFNSVRLQHAQADLFLALCEGMERNTEVITKAFKFREPDVLSRFILKIDFGNLNSMISESEWKSVDNPDLISLKVKQFMISFVFDAYREDQVPVSKWSSMVGSVEIEDSSNEELGIRTLCFQLPEKTRYLTMSTARKLIMEIDRDSRGEKLGDFVQKVKICKKEMEHQQRLAQRPHLKLVTHHWRTFQLLSFGLVVLINLLLLWVVEPTEESRFNVSEGDYWLFRLMAWTQSLCLLVSTIGYYIEYWHFLRYPMHPVSDTTEVEALPTYQDRSAVKAFYSMRKATDPHGSLDSQELWKLLCSVSYVLLCFAANFFPALYPLLLLQMFSINDQVVNIVKSITLNGGQLLITFLFALAIVFIFTTCSFLFFPSYYSENNLVCNDLFECFLTTFNTGLRSGGGIGDAFGPPASGDYWFRLVFDLCFFIIMITVLMNIVFGIIIDSFAELRDARNQIEFDMNNVCFICGMKRSIIDIKGEGWSRHCLLVHNPFTYLSFLIYLEEKDVNDCSGLEKQVKEKYGNNDLTFFPTTSALLGRIEESE